MMFRSQRRNPFDGLEETPEPPARSWLWSLLFWPFSLSRWFASLFRSRIISIGVFFLSLCAIATFVVGIPIAFYYVILSQKLDLTLVEQMPERSIVYDSQGVEMARIHGENRLIVSYDQVAPVFVHALLAREDERFFEHGAVDYIGLARAMLRNAKDRQVTQGASTITMQLARNSFPLGGKTLHRKLYEIAVAHRIEREFSKEKILEHYMNRIFWGHRVRGVEAASRFYFQKSASELNLSEAAMLAGIIRGPNLFSPFKSLKLATRERNDTLDRMVRARKITQQEADATKQEALVVRTLTESELEQNYALQAIEADLDLILQEKKIQQGGLKIFTTIDTRVQQAADQSVNQRLRAIENKKGYAHETKAAFQKRRVQQGSDDTDDPRYVQGALVLMENKSGAIRALVGGRDVNDSQFDRARKARRQVGSLFKPFVYATAFSKGLLPNSLVSDDPLSRDQYPMMPPGWEPKNSDGQFLGMQPASLGLIRSRNTMSIRIGHYAGLADIRSLAEQAGFLGTIPDQMSTYLGAFEASPLEVATAYTLFPNGGHRPRPYLIEEIRDQSDKILYRSGILSLNVYENGATWVTRHLLEKVTQSGGTAASTQAMGFHAPCGGKTGTTDQYKDAWFAGFTSRLTCAVWVGLDEQKRTITQGYGATLALPIWVDVMKAAQKAGYKPENFGPEPTLFPCHVCRFSAKLATSSCQAQGCADAISLPQDLIPQGACPQHPGELLSRPALPVDRKAIIVD